MIDPCRPFKCMTKKGRNELRRHAKIRADQLKQRAICLEGRETTTALVPK